ncbi:unnamed protein product [Ceratitis capitata]|uniref:Hexosyltransferase n=2 Tax=Ceratitis capitata TaxID=7213 RepID=A0A811VCH5_CERCA|nr:unnamed protein product [Ceratitis capitata]
MGWYSSKYAKNVAVIGIIIYILDYFGIFKHYHELDFQRHFDYPSGRPSDYDYTLIKNASEVCEVSPRLAIIVKSALQNINRRNVIRRTWGYDRRFSDVQIRRVFLLGVSDDPKTDYIVREESSKFKDIVQIDFVDTYFNNTIKTLMGMQWALKYCNSEYFFFVDDDYYVSTKNLLKFANNPSFYPKSRQNIAAQEHEDSDLFAGFVLQTPPHRHKFSKWYIPLSEYPFDLWPPYITAGAFVLNRNALLKLFTAAINIKKFRFDDIFLGIAALKANLTLTHCEMFYFNKPKYEGPSSYQNIVASHGFQNSKELEQIWNECRSAGYA